MNKQIMLGVLVAVVVVGGVALHLKSKKAPASNPSDSVPPVAVEETPTITAPALTDGTYTIATDKSMAQWEGNKSLIDWKDTGTLAVKSGSFTIANGTITAGSVVFDMQSLDALTTGKKSGEDMLEKHLKSPDFFDVEKYPTAEFKMKESATGATPGRYVVKGDLTIKGVTNPVELPVTVSVEDKTLTVDSTITLDRTKWNIRYGSDKFFDNLANNVISDNFTVISKFVASMQ